ncbi:MAG: nucleotidyltransferase family protein [Roseimicrobium sp.]
MTFADLQLDLPAVCTAHGVKSLEVFGSFARGDARDDSDLDVLVEFDGQDRYFDRFMGLKEALEAAAHRRVDLLTSQSLRNPVFKRVIAREKVPVWKSNA